MCTEILEKPETTESLDADRPTILIVDDDEILADSLSRRLSQQGFATLLADTGAKALSTARLKRPSLIVLDIRLPDTDGLAVCEQLADSIITCSIPVIILSGMERPDIIRRSRAAGCQYFVRKPYDPNALLILIQHALQEAASWEMS